ncbi:MAG: C39 family peptidase [Elusimicrobia bacterium]|nr:C39 family peptidase [Elusimicrobiota bacterium]
MNTKSGRYHNSRTLLLSRRDIDNIEQKDGARVVIYKRITPEFKFDTLLLSPFALVPQNSSLLLEVKILKNKTETPWLKIAEFGHTENISFPPQASALGAVETDIFKCKNYAAAFTVRLTIKGKTTLNGIAAIVTKYKSAFDAGRAVGAPFKLHVPTLSQMEHGGKIKKRICSPACLTMLLNYYGFNQKLADVCAGVYDKNADIYGNWIFNTFYAGRFGLTAYAARFDTMEDARAFVSRGMPLIASISFKEGELDNSPLSSTAGHLVLIKGFDGNGGVIVNDPAAASDGEVERIYDGAQFATAWLKNKRGLAYIIKP